MKPPKGAGERVYPNGRMDVGTGPKPTAAEDLEDDARWQAGAIGDLLVMASGPTSREVDERITAKLLARETSAPRTVEPDSIDSTDLAARDRPSAAEAHAADLTELLERANASNARMAKSLARHEAERRLWAKMLTEAQRPRQHGRIVSLLLWLESTR